MVHKRLSVARRIVEDGTKSFPLAHQRSRGIADPSDTRRPCFRACAAVSQIHRDLMNTLGIIPLPTSIHPIAFKANSAWNRMTSRLY